MNFNYNPYYPPQYNPQMQRIDQQYPQFTQQNPVTYPQNPQTYPQPVTRLQGKTVDSIDVVKATEIPLDFSVSYFPLTDGSAIITKQLMQDGTSKMMIYKPIEDNQEIKTPKYLTENDIQDILKKTDNKEIVSDIKSIKKQIKDITDEIEELKEGKD